MSDITKEYPLTDMDTILQHMRRFWKDGSVHKTGPWPFVKRIGELKTSSLDRYNKEHRVTSLTLSNLLAMESTGSVLLATVVCGLLYIFLMSLGIIITMSFGAILGLILLVFIVSFGFIQSIDVLPENREQGGNFADLCKVAIPFYGFYVLKQLERRFETDKMFRLQQIRAFLEDSHIPKLLEDVESIKGKLYARIKQDVEVLENDKNFLSSELEKNQYLTDADKEEFRAALEQIEQQLYLLQNDRSHLLYQTLAEAERSVYRVQAFNRKLSESIANILGTQAGAQVAAKYTGYQSSLPRRLDEISDQAISELNQIIFQSNQVLGAVVNAAPEVPVLKAGTSPVTKLLEERVTA